VSHYGSDTLSTGFPFNNNMSGGLFSVYSDTCSSGLIIRQVDFKFPHCLVYILILVLVVHHLLLGRLIEIDHAVGLVG